MREYRVVGGGDGESHAARRGIAAAGLCAPEVLESLVLDFYLHCRARKTSDTLDSCLGNASKLQNLQALLDRASAVCPT